MGRRERSGDQWRRRRRRERPMGWPCGEISPWGRAALLLLAAGMGGRGRLRGGVVGRRQPLPLLRESPAGGGSGAGGVAGVSWPGWHLGLHARSRAGGGPAAPAERGCPTLAGEQSCSGMALGSRFQPPQRSALCPEELRRCPESGRARVSLPGGSLGNVCAEQPSPPASC